MNPDLDNWFTCEVCQQSVRASRWGFGPWCDLYFGERAQACLPRTLAAIKWYEDEGREMDAQLLRLWASGHWSFGGNDAA